MRQAVAWTERGLGGKQPLPVPSERMIRCATDPESQEAIFRAIGCRS